MKVSFLVLRILALMLVIFASGVWVGRSLLPPSPEAPETEIDPEAAAQLPARPLRVFTRYVEELGLAPDQQRIAAPLLLECAREMRGLAKNTPERLAALERFHEKLSPHLDPGQRVRANAIIDTAREEVGNHQARSRPLSPEAAKSNPPDPAAGGERND